MNGKFKLQSVLNYRQSLEDQARQALGESQQRKGMLEEEQRRLQQALQQLDGELTERQRAGLTIAEIDLYESQIQHLRRRLGELQQQLEGLERKIAIQRGELIQAAREKQVMEKLKEKQLAEYHGELARKEREMLDEISLRNKGDQS